MVHVGDYIDFGDKTLEEIIDLAKECKIYKTKVEELQYFIDVESVSRDEYNDLEEDKYNLETECENLNEKIIELENRIEELLEEINDSDL